MFDEKLASLTLKNSVSILDAMRTIDQGAAQIALVTDENQKLIGIVTDGDLRRALLGGADLESPILPHVNHEFRKASAETSRIEALDLMKCYSIEQLPIVDSQGRLIGLHLLNDLIQPQQLPNAAVILAGGKGTRLGTLTQNVPKPMLKVVGRPILERIILHLIGGGIKKIFLSVNYLAEQIEDYFGNGDEYGCQISYLREDKPLGTGGPLALLQHHEITHPVIVMNGDLITDFDVPGIVGCHQKNSNQITIGVRTYSHTVPFGCITTDGQQVVSLNEKPTLQEIINTGIYVISKELLPQVPLDFFPITNLIELALDDGKRVGVFSVDQWIDVGQPKHLAEARGDTEHL